MSADGPNRKRGRRALRAADRRLTEVRRNVPDAGALVIATDHEDARAYAAQLQAITGEEVTVVDPGADRVNFGWNRLEGTRPLAGEPGPELTDPQLEYTHDEGCSIPGGYVYRGDAVPSLHGWYLFGDFCGGWVRAVPAEDPGAQPVELVSGFGPVLSRAARCRPAG